VGRNRARGRARESVSLRERASHSFDGEGGFFLDLRLHADKDQPQCGWHGPSFDSDARERERLIAIEGVSFF
jgi:hypothetical protein